MLSVNGFSKVAAVISQEFLRLIAVDFGRERAVLSIRLSHKQLQDPIYGALKWAMQASAIPMWLWIFMRS